ncbi:MAG: alpha-E domain-containing protein [Acidimicrobiales bacterium]|nr:alpha-E domain-containing protein [Acidimicrobiales bacterium]
MLGRTAGGLYWMFRQLERSENTARLIEAGMRIALTRSSDVEREWESVVATAGQRAAYLERHERYDPTTVIDFLLRDRNNPSSVRSVVDQARANAREVRTALTREVWEATNNTWLTVSEALARPVLQRELPTVLGLIRQESAIVRGSLHGTMLRNEPYSFARIGTFVERADNTARILDVKYYVLLPSASHVGSSLDNVQWETILRSVSAQRSYRSRSAGDASARGIADFLILDGQMPRSLIFCAKKIDNNLGHLADAHGARHDAHERSEALHAGLDAADIDAIFDAGLHQFLQGFIASTYELGQTIETDFRFTA